MQQKSYLNRACLICASLCLTFFGASDVLAKSQNENLRTIASSGLRCESLMATIETDIRSSSEFHPTLIDSNPIEEKSDLLAQTQRNFLKRYRLSNLRHYLDLLVAQKSLSEKNNLLTKIARMYTLYKAQPDFVSGLGAITDNNRKNRNNLGVRKSPFRVVGGNEERAPFIDFLAKQKKGGTYVGLGHEQNYDFILSSEADSAVIYDYDPRVILAHRVVQIAMEHSRNTAEFKSLFSHDGNSNLIDLLRNNSSKEEHLDAYFYYSSEMGEDWLQKLDRTSFASDEVKFQKLRHLMLSSRIFYLLGDNSSNVFLEIADITKKLNSQVQTLYVSNAFEPDWTPTISNQTIQGLQQLPLSAQSNLIFTSSFKDKDVSAEISQLREQMQNTTPQIQALYEKQIQALTQGIEDARIYNTRMLIQSNAAASENSPKAQSLAHSNDADLFRYFHLPLKDWIQHLVH